MGAMRLENLTWPEVGEEIRNGRDTIVVAFALFGIYNVPTPSTSCEAAM